MYISLTTSARREEWSIIRLLFTSLYPLYLNVNICLSGFFFSDDKKLLAGLRQFWIRERDFFRTSSNLNAAASQFNFVLSKGEKIYGKIYFFGVLNLSVFF